MKFFQILLLRNLMSFTLLLEKFDRLMNKYWLKPMSNDSKREISSGISLLGKRNIVLPRLLGYLNLGSIG